MKKAYVACIFSKNNHIIAVKYLGYFDLNDVSDEKELEFKFKGLYDVCDKKYHLAMRTLTPLGKKE